MTDRETRLREIAERVNAATEGPWEYDDEYVAPARIDGAWVEPIADLHYSNRIETKAADGTFIAHAREDVPFLLDLLAVSRAETETLKDALRAIVEHEPELEDDPTFSADVEACEECARCRKREWPPSRLCETHYSRMAKRGDRNGRTKAAQHFALKALAREALAGVPVAHDPAEQT